MLGYDWNALQEYNFNVVNMAIIWVTNNKQNQAQNV